MRTSRTGVGLLAAVAIATISMTVAACSSDDEAGGHHDPDRARGSAVG
jgi:hypothetical protein